MNFTSPKSRIQAVNQIFTSARAGLPVRDSPKTVDNFLVKWEISHARHDEIVQCARGDVEQPTGLHINAFLKECFDLDTKKNTNTKIAAYGDWTKPSPPRDRSIYRAFASVAGGERGFDEGIYGAFEHDIGPMLMDMDGLIRGIRRHSDNCVRTLDHISVAMQLHPSIDHEGWYGFAEAYATLDRSRGLVRIRSYAASTARRTSGATITAKRCPMTRNVNPMRCATVATAGPVNVSRRRATGHRAPRKTVIAERATAIARRDTVTTSAAREARFGAARGPLETANPVSTIARAHWGTKPGYLSDPQFQANSRQFYKTSDTW